MLGGVGGLEDAGAWIGAAGAHGLAHREQVDLVERAHGALGDRIEEADRLDQVAQQLEPDRVAVQRREDVDDAAAHGEGAGVLDHGGAAVAGARQQGGGGVAIDLLLGGEDVDEGGELGARDDAAGERGGRGDQDLTAKALRQAEQRGLAPHDGAAIG